MLLNIFNSGVFQSQFRRQLLATLSATIITFCHGIGLGWLSPMLPQLQSAEQTPLDFVIDVGEASWLGALISLGGLTGNFFFSFLMNRCGRKVAIYGLAAPHMCMWLLLYFAQSIEWLYVARVCAGLTGGGMYIVLPIFIGEIADNSVRGRLGSSFMLANNLGLLAGFVICSHVPYHVIPCAVIVLPVLFILLATRYPETPQQLLKWGRPEAALQSLSYYRNCDGERTEKQQKLDCQQEFEQLQAAVQQQSKTTGNQRLKPSDFCNKRAVKALVTGMVLMVANIFTGTFAFINYMSSIFATVRTQLDPNTNTIIIGVVQIVGTVVTIYLVDRHGRRLLLMISSAGSGLGLAAFGLYAFFAEETEADLSSYSAWLPVTLMACIIFMTSVGINSLTMVVLVEILPQKIRAVATSACLGCLSGFAFISLKTLPLMMVYWGLAATMWLCASVCAFCLFYVAAFLEETKGRSIYEAEEPH